MGCIKVLNDQSKIQNPKSKIVLTMHSAFTNNTFVNFQKALILRVRSARKIRAF